MMLTTFKLNHFKSYGEASLPLGPLTVLVGANASGKSNAIEGLRLLSWLAQGQKLSTIQHAIQDSERVVRGRVAELGYQDQAHFGLGCLLDDGRISLDLRLHLREDGLHISEESTYLKDIDAPLYSVEKDKQHLGADLRVSYNNFLKGGNKPIVQCGDQRAIFTQLDVATIFQEKHAKSRAIIPEALHSLQRDLSNIMFLDPVPERMRQYSYISERSLRQDGGNLSSVLFDLWGKDSDSEKNQSQRVALLDFIKSLPEQDIKTLAFLEGPRADVMVALIETFGNQPRSFDASRLSDGTLRVLAIAAALLSAPLGSLVVIEEMDNGVHPSRAEHLLASIQHLVQERGLRILLTTHNPALLDALPDAALGDVVFCYRDVATGASQLVRMHDLIDFPDLIAVGPLGYLLTSGRLDRFVKTNQDPKAKIEANLAWLNSLRMGIHS